MMGQRIKPDLRDLPPFTSLGKVARNYLQTRLRRYSFSSGEKIIECGKRGQFWALVGYGLIDLKSEDGSVRTLLPGQMFGEQMLTSDAPCEHTVTARSEAGLWVITRAQWLEATQIPTRSTKLKQQRKSNRLWLWMLAGISLLVFAFFFLGSDLLRFTNQSLTGWMLNAGRIDLADQYLRLAVRWQPASAVLYDSLGYTLYLHGNHSEAMQALQNAVSLDESLASARNNLGVALLERWQTQQAIQHLRAAVELDPGNPEVIFNLGNAYLAAGENELAAKAFHRVFELDPQHLTAKTYWAELMMKEETFDEARKIWVQILEEKPDNLAAHRGLGILALMEERPLDALLELQAAEQVDPMDAGIKLYKGLAFLALDRPGEAAAAFTAARTLTNDPALLEQAEINLRQIQSDSIP